MKRELTKEEEKKLQSICKRIEKISKELKEMGMSVYLTTTFNIMDEYTENADDVLAWAKVDGWSGGDW
jgi:hypothetical protein